MNNRLEALALAIAKENQAFEAGSEALDTLNPGLLRSHSLDRLNPVNTNGTRIFTSFQGGYRALISNLSAKCEGKTRASGESGRLSPASSLADLISTFRYTNPREVVYFLQDALGDRAIAESTPLSFFTQGKI